MGYSTFHCRQGLERPEVDVSPQYRPLEYLRVQQGRVNSCSRVQEHLARYPIYTREVMLEFEMKEEKQGLLRVVPGGRTLDSSQASHNTSERRSKRPYIGST